MRDGVYVYVCVCVCVCVWERGTLLLPESNFMLDYGLFQRITRCLQHITAEFCKNIIKPNKAGEKHIYKSTHRLLKQQEAWLFYRGFLKIIFELALPEQIWSL